MKKEAKLTGRPLEVPWTRSRAYRKNDNARLREEHQRLDRFALKKSIEEKLKKFFTALGNLDLEST